MALDPTILSKLKSMTDMDAAWHYLDSLGTLSVDQETNYINASGLKLDKSIITNINSMPDFNSAWSYLRATYPNFSPGEMADYIVNSNYSGISSPGPTGGGGGGGGGGSNIQSLLAIPTSAASVASMTGLKVGSAAMSDIGTGLLAAIMQYEVFDRAEKAAERAVTSTIAALGAFWLGAIGATMLWLSKLSHYDPNAADAAQSQLDKISGVGNASFDPHSALGILIHHLQDIIKANSGHFTIIPSPPTMPQFLLTLAIATGITTAVLAAGILLGRDGSEGNSTPTGVDVKNALAQAPNWYNSIPSAAVGILAAGLTVSGTAYSLSPSSVFRQFSVPTVQLNAQIASTGGTTPRILVLPGQNKGDYDTVYVVTPGSNGNSTVSLFQVDGNGYLVGAKGPDQNYRAFARPVVDAKGKATGYSLDQASFNALYQIPACTAIANDTSMAANKRESALETCLRNNKQVQFIPIGGS